MLHQFWDYEVDENLFEVRWRGQPLSVAPKVFDILILLIRNQHRVVTKEELLGAVWPETRVTDDALNQAIRRARLLFSNRSPSPIRTVRGRGYRFSLGAG
jgi:DNA-binding winged helix-turn-helix (wHTH) protein